MAEIIIKTMIELSFLELTLYLGIFAGIGALSAVYVAEHFFKK
jgi:cell division protein FtsL